MTTTGELIIDDDGYFMHDSDGRFDFCGACCTPAVPLEGWLPQVLYTAAGLPFVGFAQYNGPDTTESKSIIATNAAGTSWASPVFVDTASHIATIRSGIMTSVVDMSAVIVQNTWAALGALATDTGFFAHHGYRSGSNDTRLYQADQASPTTYTNISDIYTPTSPDTVRQPTLVLLDSDLLGAGQGIVGISPSTDTDNYFVSDDEDGTAWTSNTGYNSSLTSNYAVIRQRLIGGKPCVLIYDPSYRFKIRRASHVDGTAWVTSDSPWVDGRPFDLRDVDGLPGVAYAMDDGNEHQVIHFIIGDDADASGWGTPVFIPDVDYLYFPSYPDGDDSQEEHGRGAASGASMHYDSSAGTLTLHWAIFAPYPLFGEPVYDEFMGFWSYPVTGYERCIFEVTSDDEGATFTDPVKKWIATAETPGSDDIFFYSQVDIGDDSGDIGGTAWTKSPGSSNTEIPSNVFFNGNALS